jgi:threonine dehydrogenase-like Zn-dependent dehydrogenase
VPGAQAELLRVPQAHFGPVKVPDGPARNRVLTAVLRRRWRTVGAVVRDALRSGPVGRAGVRVALARLPRALRVRRRLPAAVEAARAHLDGRI